MIEQFGFSGPSDTDFSCFLPAMVQRLNFIASTLKAFAEDPEFEISPGDLKELSFLTNEMANDLEIVDKRLYEKK